MIKGEAVASLVNVSRNLSYYLGKGFCSSFSIDENLITTLSDFIAYTREFAADPAFSDRRDDIYRAQQDAIKKKEELILLKGNMATPPSLSRKQTGELRVMAGIWSQLISDLLWTSKFSILRGTSVDELFPLDIANRLNPASKEDLYDGINCLLYCLPTPAAMIFFRVAERESRAYYQGAYNGESPPNNLKGIIDKFRKDKILKESALGYMEYIKAERNKAEHPDQRYTQEGSETVLVKISLLFKEFLQK